MVEEEIGTPNLQYFECTNLSLSRAMTSTPQVIRISMQYHQLVDTFWLLQLKTLIKKTPSKCKKVSIELVHAMVIIHCLSLVVFKFSYWTNLLCVLTSIICCVHRSNLNMKKQKLIFCRYLLVSKF